MSVYLDYMATTPVDKIVFAKMEPYFYDANLFANPSNISHEYGRRALDAVEEARNALAEAIVCAPNQILWTSGATEANNMVLFLIAEKYKSRGNHIITTSIEHPSVLVSCQQLAERGFSVTYLKPDEQGLISPEALQSALTPKTTLVSIGHINSEIGVIQDIASMARIAQSQGVLFHSDCAQTLGKEILDLDQTRIDFATFSAHKCYGPKGIGALFCRGRIRGEFPTWLYGGGQEQGVRSGTLSVPLIVGLGEVARHANAWAFEHRARISALREKLWQGLQSFGVTWNGHRTSRVVHNLNVSFAGGQETVGQVMRAVAISPGTACAASRTGKASVLTQLGLADACASSSVRFSLGKNCTDQDITDAIQAITAALSA